MYDDYGRATEITIDGVTEQYTYDAQDVRVTVDGTTQLWDRSGLPTLISTGAGDNYVHVDGVARDGNDWLLADAVGSVRATVDQAGVVSAETAFTAFGEPLTGDADSFGFAGEQLDTTGLLHLRARQYNPTIGRFTTVDPVQPGAPGTTGYNLHTYSANNPTTFTDPTGQAVFVEYVQTHQIEVLAVAGVAALGLQLFLLDNSAIIEEQIEDLFDDITENLQDVALTGEDIIRQNDQRSDREEEQTTDPFPPRVPDPRPDDRDDEDDREVIIDTSAIIRKTWPALLLPREVGVITPTILEELNEVTSREGNSMPNFVPVRLVPDSINLGIATEITTSLRARRAPNFNNVGDGDSNDGLIGSTAITTGRGIITADVGFHEVLGELGGQSRLLP